MLPSIRVALCTALLLAVPLVGLVAQDAAGTFRLSSGSPVQSPGSPLPVTILGTGPVPIVLLSAHSHGAEYFESLVDRLGSDYTFHVLVPPGMGDTPPYAWPSPPDEFASAPWTVQFVSGVRAYIERTFPQRAPILAAPWETGIGQALQVAATGVRLSGVLLIGRAPFNPWYGNRSPLDTTGSFDVTAQLARMQRSIDFWRTVPESTWHANTFAGSAYTSDTALARRLKSAERGRPFAIHLRWFAEYMHLDPVPVLRTLRVPLLAIVPGGQAWAMLEGNIRGGWRERENTCVQVVPVGGITFMPWHDAPDDFDRALRKWSAALASRPPCGPRQ